MRKLVVVVTVLALAVGLVAAPVSAAKGPKGPVGDQIDVLFSTPTTFDADTPFHVIHGWGFDPSETRAVGKYTFRLDVDGVDQGKGKRVIEGVGQDGFMTRRVLFNFQDGLPAGDHEFVGHWFAPCSSTPGPCANPNAPVETDVYLLIVNFS